MGCWKGICQQADEYPKRKEMNVNAVTQKKCDANPTTDEYDRMAARLYNPDLRHIASLNISIEYS